MGLERFPEMLTVEEAAEVLRIGRGLAYELARRWEATDGREGIPVIRLGRLMRVPRSQLEMIVDGPTNGADPTEPEQLRLRSTGRHRPRTNQASLPFRT